MNLPRPVILEARHRLLSEVYKLTDIFPAGLSLQIVEIGTTRAKPGETVHDGGATITFADIARATGGMLTTVDINNDHIAYSKNWTENNNLYVNYVCEDGREFLKTFEGSIDILYLDGPTEKPENSDHVFGFSKACLENCLAKMSPTSLVVFDDTTPGRWEDKCTGCPPLLFSAGYEPHHNFPIWVRRG